MNDHKVCDGSIWQKCRRKRHYTARSHWWEEMGLHSEKHISLKLHLSYSPRPIQLSNSSLTF